MAHRRFFDGEDNRRSVLAGQPPATVNREQISPGQLPEQIRQTIRNALASGNAHIQILPLDLDEVTVMERLYMRHNPEARFTPAIVIRGVTFHDGQIKGKPMEKTEVNRVLSEISHVRDFTLTGAKNILLTEWCLYENGDHDPRLTMGKRRLSSRLSLRERNELPAGFQQSLKHTLYSNVSDLFRQFLEDLQKR